MVKVRGSPKHYVNVMSVLMEIEIPTRLLLSLTHGGTADRSATGDRRTDGQLGGGGHTLVFTS